MDWKRKLTSRKFWLAIAEFVTMLVVALGQTEQTAAKIAALIMAGAGVVAYIVGEGLADAAGAAKDEYTFIESEGSDDEKDYEVTSDVD